MGTTCIPTVGRKRKPRGHRTRTRTDIAEHRKSHLPDRSTQRDRSSESLLKGRCESSISVLIGYWLQTAYRDRDATSRFAMQVARRRDPDLRYQLRKGTDDGITAAGEPCRSSISRTERITAN